MIEQHYGYESWRLAKEQLEQAQAENERLKVKIAARDSIILEADRDLEQVQSENKQLRRELWHAYAQTQVKRLEDYLRKMELRLRSHHDSSVPVSLIQVWFGGFRTALAARPAKETQMPCMGIEHDWRKEHHPGFVVFWVCENCGDVRTRKPRGVKKKEADADSG